jgi:hypothetical protein
MRAAPGDIAGASAALIRKESFVITRTHNKLFTPVQVGAITLKHRIVMPPLRALILHEQTKQKEGPHVLPSDLAVRSHAEKSRELA